MAKKGSAEERDLVHKLWNKKFAAMRAPASGGATKRPLPDVLAGNGKIYFVSPGIAGCCPDLILLIFRIKIGNILFRNTDRFLCGLYKDLGKVLQLICEYIVIFKIAVILQKLSNKVDTKEIMRLCIGIIDTVIGNL